jgi:hypothetical protein
VTSEEFAECSHKLCTKYTLARGLTRWLEAGGGEGEGEGEVQGVEPDGAGKDERSMSGERTKFNGSGVVALHSAENVIT